VRLLLVNYEFPPVGGGASYSCRSLARHLVKRGHYVDVLTSRVAGQPKTEEVDGVLIHRVWSWRRSIHDCGTLGAATFLMFGMLRMNWLLRHRSYQLVHCYFALPCGPLALHSANRSGLPYILSLRGSDVPKYDPTNPWLNNLHKLVAPLTRKVLSRASVVVPNSESLLRLITDFYPAGNYEVIPNAALSQAVPRPPRRPNNPVRILCVSRLIARKGIVVLLQAMALLRDLPIMVDIVGDGRQLNRLRSIAAKTGVQSMVAFHGARPHDEVLRLCADADIFVHPTLSESCSMAVIEAMSAGLPIVTTRVGGNEILVAEGENGVLVNPQDSQALADALRAFVVDRERRLVMGQASTARVQRDFDPMAHAAHYEVIYSRAIAKGSTS
jgi:glycosyltransferase involved in cell wall biosynthesis